MNDEKGTKMKLVDLERPKKTKEELKKERQPINVTNEDRYPYGTCLRFEKEEIEKIQALETIKADQEVSITATGFVKVVEVTDASAKSAYPRSRKSVEIQITQVAVEPKTNKKAEQMTNEEYRQMRKGE